MDAILQRQNIDVSTEGEIVVLTIAHARAKFHYRTALRVGQHMRVNAKACMRYIEDTKRHWSDIGKLEEAELPSARLHSMTLLGALRNLRITPLPLLPTTPNKKIDVTNSGDTVRLHLGSTTHVDFFYADALKLSEWLRTAGKEAKAWAGDTGKSLSGVATLHDAAASK